MKAKEVLKVLRVTRPTLTSYVKNGRVKVKKLPNGYYDYDEDSVFKLAGITTERISVIYARVSTQKQKNDLQNQIDTVIKYANNNGYKVAKVYSDIASGIAYDRGQFMELLNNVIERKVKIVFVENKDRLTRVSFNMWKELFKQFECDLIAVNDVVNPKTDEEEIFSDIISLLHCFAMKMYSQRRKNKLRIVKEDLENEISL
jgi:predicted site-specific integrase-resolvase